jgi:hypothetical protein
MSMSSGHSSKERLATLAEISSIMPSPEAPRDFEPCAATASMFLYAQGNSVVCCHHDTLTIERRFSRHKEAVSLLAVDTVSERGAGRLVVSYDVRQTAIVWDAMTGDELARFASYENLTVAAWMRNGNVAFGRTENLEYAGGADNLQEMPKETLFCSNLLHPSISLREQSIKYQLQHWHQLRIAEHMQLGIYLSLLCSTHLADHF